MMYHANEEITMRLYRLGKVPWQESQLVYHALAYLGHESLVLVSPSSPYVCIGCHQDLEHEIDLDFCRENQIPVFRREVGGGAVYLDGDQLFFQLILKKGNREVPPRKENFYRRFLQPVINVYRHIGIPAEYKPVNDIVAGDRKISGTGVAEIGDCIVFVGNLILDFDYDMMSRVLKVPDEKFRDKVHRTLQENLTTIRRELTEEEAAQWDEEGLNALMADEFEALLGCRLESREKDMELNSKVEALRSRMTAPSWLYAKGRRMAERSVRIRSGVTITHRTHKAQGGLLRADIEAGDGRLEGVSISGDFFCYPENAIGKMEDRLRGKRHSEIEGVLKEFLDTNPVEIPGVSIEDWLKVLGLSPR